MPITIGNGGNKSVTSVKVGNGGNKTVTQIWVGNGGNKLAWAALNILGLDPSQTAPAPGPATATYALTNAGQETATGKSPNTWLIAGAASDYEVLATLNSGSLTSGTTGSWLNLGTTRAWTLQRSGPAGTTTAQITIQVRLAATGTILNGSGVLVVLAAETA